MNEQQLKDELKSLINETTSVLGGTDQTYIQFLQLMNSANRFSMPNRLFEGQMVFFKYQPVSESFISRDTYYDRFPLVIITRVYRGGFEGINLHFLEKTERKFLFDGMMKQLPVIKAGQPWRNRILVDYDRLKNRRQLKFFRPCYRRYLWKGMKRRPGLVPFELWEDMVMANAYRMINSSPEKVHLESHRAAIRNT